MNEAAGGIPAVSLLIACKYRPTDPSIEKIVHNAARVFEIRSLKDEVAVRGNTELVKMKPAIIALRR